MNWRAAVILLFCAPGFSKTASQAAAEYYYRLQDYTQALPLWTEVLQSDSRNLLAISRVAELRLWSQGRSGISEFFAKVLEPGHLSKDARSFVKAKYRELQSVFLLDASQNLYLQAKQRAVVSDLAGALEHVGRAEASEPGQLLVLEYKAELQRQLGSWDAYLASLRQVHTSFPFDPANISSLAEAQFYHSEFSEVGNTLAQLDEPLNLAQQCLRLAASVEEGKGSEILGSLRSIALDRRLGDKVPPILFYSLALAHQQEDQTNSVEVKRWYRRFVESAQTGSETKWDPYRLKERTVAATKYLAGS